ncbi:SRPBCC domain-containing protein [Arenibacter sp. 6A1]|uniref:SRPBCC family protein n=1 Tax=Arenibacter sp. 6A1 TaxID=2720391 RepID=UPI001447F212|nr:SRPBCC domain-containing protein [Arenibacter sp. 6A1]NKI27781.1 SRPBCC domain-containing protein [Arenibacter sp. 6A1]
MAFESFTKKIYIKTEIEKLYWCWATPQGITSWFLRDARYTAKKGQIIKGESDKIEAGDHYRWEWHNWEGEETGEVLGANGKDTIAFTFAKVCRLTISMEKQDDHVLLTLHQDQIPTDDKSKLQIHYGCSNGWTFWLTNLKAYLEHGILLNETTIDLRKIPMAELEFVNI